MTKEDTITQSWIEKRRSTVGSSEIMTVVKATCTKEETEKYFGEEANKIFWEESTFITPYMLYHIKKGNYETKPLDYFTQKWGHLAEQYIVNYMNEIDDIFDSVAVDVSGEDSTTRLKKLHPLYSCTPDTFVRLKKDCIWKGVELKEGELVVNEIKTQSIFKFNKSNVIEDGPAFQYIMQLLYQLWGLNSKFGSFTKGMMTFVTPLEYKYDKVEYKAYACGLVESNNFEPITKYFSTLEKQWVYDINDYTSVIDLFKLALDRWRDMLDNDKCPTPDFANEKDRKALSKTFIDNAEKIKLEAKEEYGVEDGIIPYNPIIAKKYPNFIDEAEKFNQVKSDYSEINKEKEEMTAKWKHTFVTLRVLGVDCPNFTIKAKKSGAGWTVQPHFKTTEEVQTLSVASDKNFYS